VTGNARHPQSWQDCGGDIRSYVGGLVKLLADKLGSNLTGVYLHGSLAAGSWFPPKSDIDIIVVVYGGLTCEQAADVNLAIAKYAETRPVTGSIELSVITLETARNVPEKMPFELHYSETWHEKILRGEVVYGGGLTDGDLPAHLTWVKKRGICLCGEPIDEVFGDVSWQSFTDSVREDFDWLAEGENICEAPYYGVLNLCRVLQSVMENDRKLLTKYEGARWAIENLPPEHRPVIQKALDIYSSNAPINESERRTGGAQWDKGQLLALRDYAKSIIA